MPLTWQTIPTGTATTTTVPVFGIDYGIATTTCTTTTLGTGGGLLSRIYSAGTASTTATNTIVWAGNQNEEVWVDHAQYMTLANARVVTWRKRTAAELAAAAAQAEHYRLQREQEMARRQAAQDRSRELLLSNLTSEQIRTFEKNKWFVVEGGRSKQVYRIRDKGSAVANIEVMRGDSVSHRLCGHCSHDIPLYDQLLAQKLCLQFDEDNFLKIANRHAA